MRYSSQKLFPYNRQFSRLLCVFPIILVSALSQVSFGQQGFDVSQAQYSFAIQIKNTIPGVIDAEWKSPFDLWVEADGVDQAAARNIALDVIFAGKELLQQSFCVHVHNGDFIQIAYQCWSFP